MPILEDTDFCWRLQRSGIPLHFVPDALVHIRFRPSLPALYHQAKNYGYYNVLLYKRYRPYGMPRLSPKRGLKAWLDLLTRLPQIRTKAQLARWVREFAWRVGRLQSSIKNRIFAL